MSKSARSQGSGNTGPRRKPAESPTVLARPATDRSSYQHRLARLKARRRLWLKVHLWLGLTIGLVFALIGLTGSILVFWQEIDTWLNPELHQVAAPPEGRAAYRPLNELVQAADTVMPSGARRSTMYYPRHEGLAFWFFYELPVAGEKDPQSLNAFVDPYSGEVKGTREWASPERIFERPLVSFLFELHYDLLLGWERGGWIVGVIGILAFLSTLTGLIVWWPLTGKWKQAFTLKRRASVERFNHDLHKTLGVYSTLVLLAVLISGVYFNFGDRFRWLLSCFSVTTPVKAFKSAPVPSAAPISLDEALVRADERNAEGQLYWFTVPNTPDDTYVLTRHVDIGGVFTGRRQFVVDQYSGEILHVADPLSGSGGNVFIQWQWPLHSGYALGMPGRILVLLSGIACPVLFVTGVIRWLQKRRARATGPHRRNNGRRVSPG
ncbi:PepSY-associated TM helix domain-containing protein [Methylocaldum marinum]|nr:PepSY-associated TM helix domain-containing protein [Methylocaldum marinum]